MAADNARSQLRAKRKNQAAVLELPRTAVPKASAPRQMDRVIDAIKPYNPKVIQTNLSRDSERELIEALQQSQQIGAASSPQRSTT
jgi:uncharacterized membrane protein